MFLLIAFAFLAGIITILSPCILPILPIVLSGSVGGGKRKPLGIVTGFVLSFTFFTLFLAAIVKATGLSADALRNISITIILLFGLSLLLPQFQVWVEKLFSKLAGKVSLQGTHEGFWGGVLVGLSLGLVWTPCVGPIIASVITLAATSSVTFTAFFITFAYSLGTALPMFAIMYGGRGLLQKIPWLLPNTTRIQKAFGVLMILTAIGIFFNIDRRFQTYILDTFPQYGAGLTSLEDNQFVQKQLKAIFQKDVDRDTLGKPMSDLQKNFEKAPEFIAGGKWFNSEPLHLSKLTGKVVLVDFWTYTCINCIRTLPHLRDWHEKYNEAGLVIIGVHTPEFEFEKNPANVQKAIQDFGLLYPVMQDNDYATWRAYNNRYWPAKYLINKEGEIVYTHFGEGAYEETEKKIQELIAERGGKVSKSLESMPDQTPRNIRSPETYLGSQRMEYYYPSGHLFNGIRSLTLSDSLPVHAFTLGGEWEITDEHAIAKQNAVLQHHFLAEKVFLVLRPGTAKNAQVKVFLDGREVDTTIAGQDVKDGVVTVDTDRLYHLIDFRGQTQQHILRLEFLTPGIEAFAFTFG
jgi:cytochrome c biogenesis protein CcdA/thiol-disulfide isomerase/thioredoxin